MKHPQTEPFFFAGGSRGCLLIHGFSGSPTEMRGLGEHLAAQGHTVLAVQLAGHGSTPEAMQQVRWRDWLASATAGFSEIRKQCEHVTVIGFSLGGALGLMLAHQRHFEQLVILATPLTLQGDWRLSLLPVARFVIPWYYPLEHADFNDPLIQERMRRFAPDIDLSDPHTVAQIRRSVRIPVHAINELQQALHAARRLPPKITIPTVIMHGCEDEIAPLASATELYRRLGSTRRELIWWEETGHHLLEVGQRRTEIYESIATFVENTLSEPPITS